ncbi:MAG: hypothetical protein ABIK47_07575 [candidate division WOR-3 bacterium]
MMNRLLILFIPLMLFGQVEVDTVIYPPLPSGHYLLDGFFIPELNKLYIFTGTISGPSSVIVLDCSTYQYKTEFWWSWGQGQAFFTWNRRRGKFYFTTNGGPDSTLVIDAVADTVIQVFRRYNFVYVPCFDRFYGARGETLFVFDGATDSIIKRIPSPIPPYKFAYTSVDSVNNKIYVVMLAFQSPFLVGVFDCAVDSFLKFIDVSGTFYPPYLMNFNYTYRKAYFVPRSLDGYAGVIDTKNDTVRRYFPIRVWVGYENPVAVNHTDNKVYIAGTNPQGGPDTLLYVIDCDTDSIVKKVTHYGYAALYVRWVPWSNRVYFAHYQDTILWVLDCQTDSIIAGLCLGGWAPVDLQFDPIRQRIFAIGAGYDINAIYVLRDVVPGVEEKKVEMSGNLSLPTVIRNVLKWEPVSGHRSSVLLDVSGRKVLDLLPGANDIRHLAPGVYFVHILSDNKTRPVVIVK